MPARVFVFQRDAIHGVDRAVLAVRSEHHSRILPASARPHAKAPFLITPVGVDGKTEAVSPDFFFRGPRTASANQLCDLYCSTEHTWATPAARSVPRSPASIKRLPTCSMISVLTKERGGSWRVPIGALKRTADPSSASNGLCHRYFRSRCWFTHLAARSSLRCPGWRSIPIGAPIRYERTALPAPSPQRQELHQAGPGPFRAAAIMAYAAACALLQLPTAKPSSGWVLANAVSAASLSIASDGISIFGAAVWTGMSSGMRPVLLRGGYGPLPARNCSS